MCHQTHTPILNQVVGEGRGPNVQESKVPRVQRSKGSKLPGSQDISKSYSNTSLTLKKVHLVQFQIEQKLLFRNIKVESTLTWINWTSDFEQKRNQVMLLPEKTCWLIGIILINEIDNKCQFVNSPKHGKLAVVNKNPQDSRCLDGIMLQNQKNPKEKYCIAKKRDAEKKETLKCVQGTARMADTEQDLDGGGMVSSVYITSSKYDILLFR